MKIAKKVLALVMAVAMVACFAAMAFAATPTAETAFKVAVEEGTGYAYAVVLSIEKGIGLKSGGVYVKYDPAVLVYQDDNADGKDAKAMASLIKASNSFTYEVNSETEGVLDTAFYFKEDLWTTEKFLAEKKNNAKEEDVRAIDVNSFDLIVFYFELADGATADDIAVTLEAKDANFVGDNGEDVAYNEIKCISVEKKEEATTAAPETTTKAPEETTKAPEAPSTPEATTKPGIVEGPNTGDTGVLAIAAGVVALAGAAFVVSKKRK